MTPTLASMWTAIPNLMFSHPFHVMMYVISVSVIIILALSLFIDNKNKKS